MQQACCHLVNKTPCDFRPRPGQPPRPACLLSCLLAKLPFMLLRLKASSHHSEVPAGEPSVVGTVDAAEARPVAEFDTDGQRTAVQKFLYPDREELPDDFSMPIWVRKPASRVWRAGMQPLLLANMPRSAMYKVA